jgi:CheY-like chemotaxis protein
MTCSVLIVDDDIKLAALVKTYFEKERFTAFEVHDGNSVVPFVRQKNRYYCFSCDAARDRWLESMSRVAKGKPFLQIRIIYLTFELFSRH